MSVDTSTIPVPLPVDFGPTVTDWLMVYITGFGVVATLVIGVFTFIANYRAGRAAKYAALANERAQEAQIANVSALITASPRERPESRAQWKIVRGDGDHYELVNVGPDTVYDVEIDQIHSADEPQDLYTYNPAPMTLSPQAGLPFLIARSIVSAPVTPALITWRDESGRTHHEQRLIR